MHTHATSSIWRLMVFNVKIAFSEALLLLVLTFPFFFFVIASLHFHPARAGLTSVPVSLPVNLVSDQADYPRLKTRNTLPRYVDV